MEWIDPRYSEMVDAWESAQAPDPHTPEASRPVRAFIATVEPEPPAS
ncbi:hypothetical protein [Streptomyces sp. SID8358]|nr:hypothetical protein [Streptomyces sp. SID8358]